MKDPSRRLVVATIALTSAACVPVTKMPVERPVSGATDAVHAEVPMVAA